ncbi:MAG: alpha/beta hydrolase [Planctomycetota bacterium]|nr:MAG: alpha/beta hydrolase [Planctomycetota bacterium]RKY20677.1 MAG: alpha/beta hydrolase [Planctomycetota bacterium]
MPALTLETSAGQLAALHDAPTGPHPGAGPRGAVVCHPHPLHGGTKENKVVHSLAKAFAAAGLHVLRFDFRGAGGSEGSHDEGVGERDDVRAAMDACHELAGGSLLLAGFSFGSWVGLDTGLEDRRVEGLLAVAPPVNYYDYTAVARSSLPLAVVYALEDELVPADQVQAWLASCARSPRITPVSGCGHLFHGRLGLVRGAAAGLAAALAS